MTPLASPHLVPVAPPTPAQRLAERAAPPAAGCIGHQRWHRLLFLHWTVPADLVQATLPPGLFVDTWEGQAFVGLVPFFMQRVRPRGLPPLPGLSWFLELNVRTYVHDAQARPGVWFYSLDCNQPIAVGLARRFFHLPYEHARMGATCREDACEFHCLRRGQTEADHFAWSAPSRGGRLAEPGGLEFFLIERYLFFAADRRGRLFSGRVRHEPYRLHDARLARHSVVAARLAGLPLAGPPVSALAAETVAVSLHPLEEVSPIPKTPVLSAGPIPAARLP